MAEREEMEKALKCLYIAVDEDVAKDVAAKVHACLAAQEEEISDLHRALTGQTPTTLVEKMQAQLAAQKRETEELRALIAGRYKLGGRSEHDYINELTAQKREERERWDAMRGDLSRSVLWNSAECGFISGLIDRHEPKSGCGRIACATNPCPSEAPPAEESDDD